MARVNVNIPEELKARVDERRATEKRSLRAVVEIALERYLASGKEGKRAA
jgi:metal-responsive CopG/Arc/MetJ family transcriptional regulator